MTTLLPPAARALLKTAFPGQPIYAVAATVGGFSNLTLALTIGTARCVAKIATRPTKREDLHREAAALTWLVAQATIPALPGQHLAPIPTLRALLDDETTTVELLDALPGVPGITRYDGGLRTLSLPLLQLCKHLAGVHMLPVPSIPALTGGIELLRGSLVLDDPQLDDDLRRAFSSALEHIGGRPQICFTHGDPGLHNILVASDEQDLSGLLDWEWAGAGEPARDLAWLRWTLHWRGFGAVADLGTYRVYSGKTRAYIDGQFDPVLLDAYALARIAAILGGLEPHERGEWIRRARWTITAPRIP